MCPSDIVGLCNIMNAQNSILLLLAFWVFQIFLQIYDVHQPFRCCCGQAHADRLFGRFFFDFFHGMLLIDINVYVYIIYVYFNCIIASYRPHNNRKFIFSEKRKLFIARNVNKNSPGHFCPRLYHAASILLCN